MGYSYCRFRCGIENQKMGSSSRYDGEWVWPEGLAHYLESHSVRLPDEFIATMRSRCWQPPSGHPQLRNPERPQLKLIGFWCDNQLGHTPSETTLPHPKSLIQPDWMKAELPLIIEYLRSSPDLLGDQLDACEYLMNLEDGIVGPIPDWAGGMQEPVGDCIQSYQDWMQCSDNLSFWLGWYKTIIS